ncbi:MAG: HAD family hydrolase [Flavisolibacter sp.]
MPGNQKNYKAFLFDLNGTMIDDMPYHIKAWHGILREHDPSLSYEGVKAECYGKNEELLERIFPGHFSEEQKNQMIHDKEKRYKEVFKSELRLINGLHEFLESSHKAGIKIGIGTAAIIGNVDFVLDGVQIRDYIDAIVSADDVDESKPHPETFLTCAQLLGVDPNDCLVFEDTPKGAESAFNAGIDCVIITTLHHREEFLDNKNVIGFISTFDDPFIKNLIKWKETA